MEVGRWKTEVGRQKFEVDGLKIFLCIEEGTTEIQGNICPSTSSVACFGFNITKI
jgi:hypothetical protein